MMMNYSGTSNPDLTHPPSLPFRCTQVSYTPQQLFSYYEYHMAIVVPKVTTANTLGVSARPPMLRKVANGSVLRASKYKPPQIKNLCQS